MYVDALLALFGSILGNTVTGVNAFASGATVVSPNAIDLASGGNPTGQVRDLGEGSDFDVARDTSPSAIQCLSTPCEWRRSDSVSGRPVENDRTATGDHSCRGRYIRSVCDGELGRRSRCDQPDHHR